MRKLAHIRSLEGGLRTWDSPRYMIPGVSPSTSAYDAPEEEQATNVTRWTPNEFTSPTPQRARPARVAAQFESLAAGSFFQGTFVTNWDHLIPSRPMLDQGRPALAQNFNPNQPGSKEQQRATVYNPWPSFGALSPKAI